MGKLLDSLMAPIHQRKGIDDALKGKPPSILKAMAGKEHSRPYDEGYKIGLQMRSAQAVEKLNRK